MCRSRCPSQCDSDTCSCFGGTPRGNKNSSSHQATEQNEKGKQKSGGGGRSLLKHLSEDARKARPRRMPERWNGADAIFCDDNHREVIKREKQPAHTQTQTLTNVSSCLNPQLVQIRNITKKLSPVASTFLGITHIY